MSKRIRFVQEFNYFCSKIEWKKTEVDARSKRFFNLFEEALDRVIIEEKQFAESQEIEK